MRIAVPYENGMVVPAFEQATMFKLYDTEKMCIRDRRIPGRRD